MPAQGLHGATAGHRSTLWSKKLPVRRSTPLAHACAWAAERERGWRSVWGYSRAGRLCCAELHHRRPAALGPGSARAWHRRLGLAQRPSLWHDPVRSRNAQGGRPASLIATPTQWPRGFEQHPGTEIISRDRGGIYAEAARRAAPQAVQVADRWHLLRNLSEALCRAICTAPSACSCRQQRPSRPEQPTHLLQIPSLPGVSASLLVQQANRQRRYETMGTGARTVSEHWCF